MIVPIRLYGVFRSAARSKRLEINLSIDQPTVRTAIAEIASRPNFRELTQLVLDEETWDPRPNALIMVSGREINTLEGLDTKLKASDELSLLPIAHGG